jgi:ABC-type transport system involved in multi-copper enzyme maturation permease subunit
MFLVLALELSVAAARMFRSEIQWQTLSSIAILPVTVRELVYQKFLACILSAAPTIFYILMGLVLLVSGSRFRLDDASILVPLMFLAQALFLIHLTAFLSLLMKRAALPVAFGLTLLGNMVVGAFLGFTSRGDFKAFMCLEIILLMVPTGILHAMILDRVPRAAAD